MKLVNQPLPDAMQGKWVVADEPKSEPVIDGDEITCFGKRVAYDYMEIGRKMARSRSA
jgi:hypothetical protein